MKIDWWIAVPILILSIISILSLASVEPNLVKNQLLFALTSAVAFIAFSKIDIRVLLSTRWLIIAFFCILHIALFFISDPIRGSHRWIIFGPISIQPSEIVKPFLLLLFSYQISQSSKKEWFKGIITAIFLSALVLIQPDLGTSLIIISGWITILIFRVPIKTVFYASIIILLISIPSYNLILKDYQKERITTFLDPYKDPLGKGYHVIQSMISVGSGGLVGKGLGQGSQSQLMFLPEHHTDFIFASIAEEWGLLGGIICLGLLGTLSFRLWHISQSANDLSYSLFSSGLFFMFSFQVLVNIGMNMGIAPVTGVTLPFLSYGGSSLLSLAISFALVNQMSVARESSFRV